MKSILLFIFGGFLLVGALSGGWQYFVSGFKYVEEITSYYQLPSEFFFGLGFLFSVALIAKAYDLITR